MTSPLSLFSEETVQSSLSRSIDKHHPILLPLTRFQYDPRQFVSSTDRQVIYRQKA